MQIFTDFRVSKPTKHNWSGVFGYRPEKSSIATVYGEMFAVMSISSEVDFELSHIGEMLFDEMQASYFEEFKTELNFGDFEQAMTKVHERIAAVLDREPELASEGIDLEIAVVVVKGDAMYGGVVGESKIYINRGENFAEIGKSFIDANNDGFMRSGSLELDKEDRLLLVTSKLAAKVEDKAAEMLTEFKLSPVGNTLGAMLAVGYHLAVDPKLSNVPLSVTEDQELESELPIEGGLAAEVEGNKVDAQVGQESQIEDEDDSPLPLKEAEFGSEADDLLEGEADMMDDAEAVGRLDSLKQRAAGILTQVQNRALLAKNAASKKLVDIKSKRLQRLQDDGQGDEQSDSDVLGREVAQQSQSPSPTGSGALGMLRVRAQELFTRLINITRNGMATIKSQIMPSPGDRAMYLRKGRSQTKWKTMIVAGVVIMLVLVLVINKRNEEIAVERHIQEVQTQIAELENSWQQVKTEASAASIGEVPSENKQQIAVKISDIRAEANDLLAEDIGRDRLEKILTETQKSQDALFNVRSFTEPQVVADLELTFEGADASAGVYAGGNIYVADRARGVVYRMGTTLNSEVSALVTGLSSPYLLTVDPGGNPVFVDNNADSIVGTIDATTAEVRRSPSLGKARIGDLSGMDIYDANAAMYSVNPAKTAIFKQENISGNYVVPNDASPWRTDADFANAVALRVDYSIFLLVKGKGLLRYEGGEPAGYSPNGFTPNDVQALNNASTFDLTATKLYIADPANRRLIVAERTNADNYTFKEQYVYQGDDASVFTKMQAVFANEAGGKIYVLDGNRVIRLDI